MEIKEVVISEWQAEINNTQKLLEAVDEKNWDWSPHPKSWTTGELITHLINIPTWMAPTILQDSLDLSPAGEEPPRQTAAQTLSEALQRFAENCRSATEILKSADTQALSAPWSLLMNGKARFTMPRYQVLRNFILNHLIHHRGQLTLYLRICDLPVPELYGPSADEK
ncbi:MAG: DinB family protein [Calditrichia bacterium]